MSKILSIADEARISLNNLAATASDLTVPSVRLGVTGLARAGKTVFITALVHNLIHGGRLPLFNAYSSGRLSRAQLQPQPDDAVPRFDYENHVAALVNERIWPSSTRQVSELRLTIEYESASYLARKIGPGKLHLDLIDYPGEWLLDLPLLKKSYAEFSADAMRLARSPKREKVAKGFLESLATIDPKADESEQTAQQLSQLFKTYLADCRDDTLALSMLPPGRFLMPGELEGTPALTFAPLDIPSDAAPAEVGSLRAMMERRYEAYKSHVVRPFFRDHFARLDRQIVLVDVLHALNAGRDALHDLELALGEVLTTFRPGRKTWLNSILSRRIDRILFAATKADHLHRADHDRLQGLLKKLVARGMDHARFKGADVEVLAMAAVRATREASIEENNEELPAIVGTPLNGETVNGSTFDGQSEIVFFPGDLPQDIESIFAGVESTPEEDREAIQVVRFRPPPLTKTAEGMTLSLPHIRLDRAIEFLIGDRLA